MFIVSPLARGCVAALVFCALIAQPARSASAKTPVQQAYLGSLRARASQWRSQLPALQVSAAAAAKGALAGGHLYLAGPQQSFIWEGTGRAGGLMLAEVYAEGTALHPRDTVLAAADGSPDRTGALPALIQKAAIAHAHVVLFANGDPAVAPRVAEHTFLSVFPTRPFVAEQARKPAGLESISNVIGLWAWSGEFVAGCVAGGKMPAIYESIWIPGGRARDAALQGARFHSVSDVTPEGARGLGARWLEEVESALTRLATKDRQPLARAAALLAEAHRTGHTVLVASESHMFPVEFTGQTAPVWLHPADLPAAVKTGDCVLMLGYQEFPWPLASYDGPCILTCVHPPPSEFTHRPGHVYVDPFWQYADNCVDLPGYNIKLFPLSGVVQGAIFWQLVQLSEP